MKLSVENVGAVSAFKAELPASGVYVFRGRNGTGKTTLVNAVSTAMGGGDAVPVRDNAERAKLELGEVTMTVGARKSIKGEIAVVGLAGRFSIADLVDPGIAKPESADAARIKALVSIAQVEPRKNLESSPAADVAAMDGEIQAAKDSLELHEALELQAEAAYQEAEKVMNEATSRVATAHRNLAGVRRLAEQVAARASVQAGWRASIEAAESVQQIPDSEVSAADLAVTIARGAVEQGAIIRRACVQEAARVGHEIDAAVFRTQSDELREAAKRTDEVLSSVVAKTGSPLRVEAGRLLLDTGRGPTLFADLSHGEKYRVAIDLAVDAVGAAGLLHLPQEAWEGLDPENRRAIHEHAVKRGVRILTAEADGGELRGEAYPLLVATCRHAAGILAATQMRTSTR